MKLVIAEKPSVAMSLAAVLGANEKKDGYLEGGGYLVSWCVGTFWNWHSRRLMGNSMPDGVMVICRSCRKHGNMRCRRIRKSSLTFFAG